jgi:hypothetical protein
MNAALIVPFALAVGVVVTFLGLFIWLKLDSFKKGKAQRIQALTMIHDVEEFLRRQWPKDRDKED